MASTEELLAKQKNKFSRLSKASSTPQTPTIQTEQIQLERGGATRPWQEHLPQYQKPSEESKTKEVVSASKETILQKGVLNSLATCEQDVSNALATEIFLTEELQVKTKKHSLAARKQDVSSSLAKDALKGKRLVSNPLAISKRAISLQVAVEHLETLGGKEKQLLLFIFKQCQLGESLESGSIPTKELQQSLEVNANHLRNLIFRLSKKGLVHAFSSHTSRLGFRKFRMQVKIYQKLSDSLATR